MNLKMRFAQLIVVLQVSALLPLTAQAADVTGKVVGVVDGDTLVVLSQGRPVKIRLANIDAPELHGQAFGMASKQALSGLVFNQEVRVVDRGNDRYGRMIGEVLVGGINVNRLQVKKGMAWVYEKYNTDPTLPPLELAARSAKLGLWADSAAVPPWEFRHAK